MFNIDLRSRVSKIKLFVFDVDGVMTDGGIIYDENGVEYKIFNAKDGQGIVMLTKAGIKTAIITARNSEAVRHRFENLGMTKLYMGQKNKLIAMKEMLNEFKLDFSEAAYMGDDLPDLCVLKEVGFDKYCSFEVFGLYPWKLWFDSVEEADRQMKIGIKTAQAAFQQ